jgi:hypothetical protein
MRPTEHARRRPRTVAALIGLAGLCLGVAPAWGQAAPGDGRALDANPGVGSRFNAARPSFAQELQFRNAIVTGNAPGGLSFRGDLGYRAPGEFTGDMGSDELFAFRRDSLYSGLAGMGIRGTDALQYQFSLTTGARPPQNLMGDFSYTRDTQYERSVSFTSPSTISPTVARDPDYIDTRGLDLYQPSSRETELIDALTGSLRSSAAYTSTTNLSPVILSTFEGLEDRQQYGLTASTLTGVTTVPMRADAPQPRGPGRDAQGARPTDPRDIAAAQPGDQNPSGTPRDPTAGPRTAYQEVVERVRARAAEQAARDANPADAEMQTIMQRIEALRNGMMGAPDPAPGPGDPAAPGAAPQPRPDARSGDAADDPRATGPARPASPGLPTAPNTRPDPAAAPGGPGPGVVNPTARDPRAVDPNPDGETRPRDPSVDPREDDRSLAERDPARFKVDARTLELIRAGETPLEGFIDPDADVRDLYSEHMRAGERLIAAERYFDAEERFARALSMRSGDPTAQVGRAHAQLGAGLTLSAAINLRALFVSNPEIMGARYAGRLLPAPDRINVLIDSLRARAGLIETPGREPEAASTRVAAAFLVAYLGFQNNQPATIREGLDAIRSVGAPEDVRLATILAQVWLPEAGPDASNAGEAP